MKFKDGVLKHVDGWGDVMSADVSHIGDKEAFLCIDISGHLIYMTREEARKFAKAIRKEVRRQVWEVT